MITAGLRVLIFQLKVVERWLCDFGYYHRLGPPASQTRRRENSGMTAPLPPIIVSVQNFTYIAIDQRICGEYIYTYSYLWRLIIRCDTQ